MPPGLGTVCPSLGPCHELLFVPRPAYVITRRCPARLFGPIVESGGGGAHSGAFLSASRWRSSYGRWRSFTVFGFLRLPESLPLALSAIRIPFPSPHIPSARDVQHDALDALWSGGQGRLRFERARAEEARDPALILEVIVQVPGADRAGPWIPLHGEGLFRLLISGAPAGWGGYQEWDAQDGLKLV